MQASGEAPSTRCGVISSPKMSAIRPRRVWLGYTDGGGHLDLD